MKRKCGYAEKWLSSGFFGGSLSELPESIESHIQNCESCRDVLTRLQNVEMQLVQVNHSDLSELSRDGIKRGVMSQIERISLHTGWTSRSLIAIGCVVGILIIFFVIPKGRPGDQTLLLSSIDPSELEESLVSETSFSDFDQTSLTRAVVSQFNSELLSNTMEIVDQTSTNETYTDAVLTELESFSENDWEELRRFLS